MGSEGMWLEELGNECDASYPVKIKMHAYIHTHAYVFARASMHARLLLGTCASSTKIRERREQIRFD